MKKSFIGFLVLFILLTTYKPKFKLAIESQINIKKIEIKNNSILNTNEIKKSLNFLYEENLLFLNSSDIENKLMNITFIESYSIKKIYPNIIQLSITEKKPIAILQIKKEKFYISDKGEFIKYRNIDVYKNLPVVFGNRDKFYSLYKNLQDLNFPLKKIKSFYYFESDRWDLALNDGKVIKLPIKDYLLSLENFMNSTKNNNLNNYKLFDYRIKDQLILN
jgi:cell division protein FtsQ